MFLVAAALPILAPAARADIGTNSRRLLVDGKPFFINADTGWTMLTRISDRDAEYYLETRQRQGFNTILADIIPGKSETNVYGEAPFFNNDMTQRNEAYWQRIDRWVQRMADKGLVMVFKPATTCCNWGQGDEFNETSGLSYGQFLGQRYRKYNIVWEHCGDLNPGGKEGAIKAMVVGIRQYAPNQPHTCHPNSPNSAVDVLPNDVVDLNLTYTYDPENKGAGAPQYHVYDRSLRDYNREPRKPFYLGESKYEGEGVSVQKIRRQAYWSVLSGSTGHSYGNEVVCVNKPGWKDHLNDPGARQMRHVRDVFTSRNWANLVPDQYHKWVTKGYGTYYKGTDSGGDDYVTTAYTPDGKLLMAYLPEGGSLTVNLSKFNGDVKAQWFDPTNGSYTDAGRFNNSGSVSISSPGSNGDGDRDWVLVMETGKGTPRLAADVAPKLIIIQIADV